MAKSNNGSTTSAPTAEGPTTNPDTTPNTKNAEKTGKGPVHPLTAGAAGSSSKPTQGNRVGKSGVVTDSAKVEQQTDPNAGMGPQPVGITPDPVERRTMLANAFQEIENVVQRVEGQLAAHYDINGLRRHLYGARDWLAKELGYTKRADGGYFDNAGGAASSSLLGQTTHQVEASKAKEGEQPAKGMKSGYSDKDSKKTSEPVTTGANQESTAPAKDAKKGGNKPS